jgi:hypothetical protein
MYLYFHARPSLARATSFPFPNNPIAKRSAASMLGARQAEALKAKHEEP